MNILDWQCAQLKKLASDNIKAEVFRRIENIAKIILDNYPNVHCIEVPNLILSSDDEDYRPICMVEIGHSKLGEISEDNWDSVNQNIITEDLIAYYNEEYDDYFIPLKDGQKLHDFFIAIFSPFYTIYEDDFYRLYEHNEDILFFEEGINSIVFTRNGRFFIYEDEGEDNNDEQ